MNDEGVRHCLIRGRHRGLPRGLGQAACDGPVDLLAQANESQLWLSCGNLLREEIAERFVDARGDDLRDCLIAAQNTRGNRGMKDLGLAIWQCWTKYREQALDQLYRRGRFHP